jgi:hypothetical protein
MEQRKIERFFFHRSSIFAVCIVIVHRAPSSCSLATVLAFFSLEDDKFNQK